MITYGTTSLKKHFFQVGKTVVRLMDALGGYGFVPCAFPNYGGLMGDKASVFGGNTVDWPCLMFKRLKPQARDLQM